MIDRLKERFPKATFEEGLEPTMLVEAGTLPATLEALKTDSAFQFDWLVNETAVDYPPERIRMVYNLISSTLKHRMCVHVDLPRSKPVVGTVAHLFAGAIFYEREILDLFGVAFPGHPYPKRIMMDDDFVGHPLRKDFTSPNLIKRPER